MTRSLLIVGDLFFTARIGDTLAHLGIDSQSVRDDAALDQALAAGPFHLAVIELSIRSLDALAAIRRLKDAAPEVPVLAFAGHLESQLMADAQVAGADQVVTNGQISAQLPALVRGLGVATGPRPGPEVR
jgi:DNA-binding NarL/FixJ family response regulator